MATATVDIHRLIAAGQLPALPQSAITLLQLSKDPDVDPAEFAVPIETDPGLTSQVLRFVNSSYFGFPREISNVKTAITLVGMRTIKNFALWSAVFSLMPNPKCGPFDLRCLWQDSLRRALFARKLAKHLGAQEVEEPFAAALLQDMAVPLLAKEFPDIYLQLLNSRMDGHNRLSNLERERFGCAHSDVAGVMARQWNLPEAMARLIEHHTDIDMLIEQAADRPAEVAVALSALLPANHDNCWPEATQFLEFYQRLPNRNSQPIQTVLSEIDAEFADFAPVLKITTPKKSLIEYLSEGMALQHEKF